MIILGDAGINYYGEPRDSKLKKTLSKLSLTIFSIHGNHEIRPKTIPSYREVEWNGGIVYREDRYPNLLFAKDGEVYDIGGIKTLVIGGAYSVDKQYRIDHGYGWWADEQPGDEIKTRVEKALSERGNKVDVILSHTTPLKYEPVECFFEFIDQSKVDRSTEIWLDGIEERTDYKKWYAGHFHTEKRIDKLRIMFEDIAEFCL
ncbi:MAG: metallophosphoesterase [Ruminococcus sp.]|nr:metallophosphoesterase [Ruminococcus sp.]